jgi:SAM-dependent MidA family methyltransferase
MTRLILPEPAEELKQLSRMLSDRIRSEMSDEGLVPFSRFMEMALYEPGLGYYSAGLHKLGAGGDFVTAPELGSLFARCLAQQAAEVAEELDDFDILEVGAGTGRLAADLLLALPANRLPRRYRILERSADLRRAQQDRIAALAPALAGRVEWLDRPPGTDWQGLLLANEVLDALAVERFRIGSSGVEQLCVQPAGGCFAWAHREAPAALRMAVEHIATDLGAAFPDGYRSEVSLLARPWLEALTRKLVRGLALFVDYGYPRREYYLPERSDGTLMCHYRHQVHDDAFFWPGLQDITAWVDFTALAEAADHCGLDVEGFSTQSFFLLGCGLDRLLREAAPDGDGAALALNNEAKQLTLPGLMGERFKVMGLGRKLGQPPKGFSLQDLRHRL